MTPATAHARPWEPSWQPPGPSQRPPEPDPELAPWLAERLYARRIVFLRGTITATSASTAAATLLSLDRPGGPGGFGGPSGPGGFGSGAGEPVQLHIAAADGDLDAVLTLIDAVDSLRVPVHAVATGEVGGAAVGVYAAATRRLAFPHARFRLAEPRVADIVGTADDVASAAGRHLRALEDLLVRVAEATGRPRSKVEDDFGAGRLLDVAQARDYGLVHDLPQAP